MSEVAVAIVGIVPVSSLAASGFALLGTRSRLAGFLLIVTSAGLGAALVTLLSDEALMARHLLAASLLPGSFAVLAFPRPRFQDWIEYCFGVTAGAAAVIGTALVSFDSAASATLASVGVLALVGHGWRVLETGDDEDQQAILWLGLAALLTALFAATLPFEYGVAGTAVTAVPAATIGPAMVIGVRGPTVTDIRALVVSVIVLFVVAVTYLSVFIAVVATLEVFGVDDPPWSLYAAIGLALAAGFHPLRVVMRGLIDELLFGDRLDPLAAATTVADRIGDDPLLALQGIREALLFPHASLYVDGEELAASGTKVTDTQRVPLMLGDELVGHINVGLRPGQLTLSADDEQVLHIIGPLFAQTLRARALALDLKASRTVAIAAIEEERRRLRRDLHDGLGPTLSGIAHTAAAARNSITTDPKSADALLRGLRSDAADAVGEIRRLVYDMRPPALDELGLVEALRQQLALARTPAGRPMQVSLEADELPGLRASVEVAAYRIATEAVTNSARHSGTDQVWVAIGHERDQLLVTVRDGGESDGTWVPGVGLSSMRERAAEIGGFIDTSSNGHGSEVVARLPLTPSASTTSTRSSQPS
ncbi:MAG: sensor histidine kinase [Microthrixaceae bacterium]